MDDVIDLYQIFSLDHSTNSFPEFDLNDLKSIHPVFLLEEKQITQRRISEQTMRKEW